MKKIIPLGDNVLVKPQKQEEKTASGILLPDTAKEKPQEGEVIAVGEGKNIPVLYKDKDGNDMIAKIPMKVKPLDKIMYKKWGGNEIKLDGEEHMLISQDDILAIVE